MKPSYPKHWVYDTFLKRMVAPAFKPAGRKSVKGGRWQVRKMPVMREGQAPWSALSRGRAGHLSRRFHTHAEAVEWAQRVAAVYAMKSGAAKDEAYYQLRVDKYGPNRVLKGKFPDRPTSERGVAPWPLSPYARSAL